MLLWLRVFSVLGLGVWGKFSFLDQRVTEKDHPKVS